MKIKELLTKKVVERFWKKIKKGKPKECWEWQASKTKGGYGRFAIPGLNKEEHSHRISWVLSRQEDIHDGMYVLHSCDNPECCNPNHLFTGTQQDNIDDMRRKGRGAKGETIGSSKLTSNEVLEIKRRYGKNGMNRKKLASEFGISEINIWNIINRNTWKHLVPESPDEIRITDGNKKLSTEQVIEIRNIYNQGGISQAKLAAKFNVTQSCISRIITFNTRKNN